MRLLRIIGKILAFPVMLIVTVIQWLLATWPEALRAVLAGFIVFMIPVIGQSITAVIALFREGLSDFIWS